MGHQAILLPPKPDADPASLWAACLTNGTDIMTTAQVHNLVSYAGEAFAAVAAVGGTEDEAHSIALEVTAKVSSQEIDNSGIAISALEVYLGQLGIRNLNG